MVAAIWSGGGGGGLWALMLKSIVGGARKVYIVGGLSRLLVATAEPPGHLHAAPPGRIHVRVFPFRASVWDVVLFPAMVLNA